MLRVLSLGWGVQSFAVAVMAALGDIPPIDAAVHADTLHERQATYAFAARWSPWLEARGVRVVTVVSAQAQTVEQMARQADIPAFTLSGNGRGRGQLRRQCTYSWKIAAVRKWLQANRDGQAVTQLLGISTDERRRAKESDVKYVTHEWPLLDLGLSRADCVEYLVRHGLEVPGKSACVMCPYHDKEMWREMWREGGADWRHAVEVDEAIRESRPPFDLFVHRSRRPLVEVDFRTPEERGQLRLLGLDRLFVAARGAGADAPGRPAGRHEGRPNGQRGAQLRAGCGPIGD